MRLLLLVSMATMLSAAVYAAGTASQPKAGPPDVALLVIDIQNFYFPGGQLPLTGPEQAASEAARVIQAFRGQKLPVIHVRHMPKTAPPDDGVTANDVQYRIRPEVQPVPGEKIFTKHYANSFRDTGLADYLRANGIRRLVIVGMQTHMCVEAAARAAADLGYDVTVVYDACATRPLEHGGVKVPAEQVHAAALAAVTTGGYGKVVTADQLLKTLAAPALQ